MPNVPATKSVNISAASILAQCLAALVLSVTWEIITWPFASARAVSSVIRLSLAPHRPAATLSAVKVILCQLLLFNNLSYALLKWLKYLTDSSDFCNPTPCGANTKCQVENSRAVCSCLDGWMGNPIQGCRRECESDSECDANRACTNFRCQDPCGSCGTYADCNIRVSLNK